MSTVLSSAITFRPSTWVDHKSSSAFNSRHELVIADQVTDNEACFFCHCLDHRHRVKFVRPSGNLQKRSFRPYFAEISRGYKRNSAGERLSDNCRKHCCESEEHLQAKALLRDRVGNYKFDLCVCSECKKVLAWENGSSSKVELEKCINGKIGRAHV